MKYFQSLKNIDVRIIYNQKRYTCISTKEMEMKHVEICWRTEDISC